MWFVSTTTVGQYLVDRSERFGNVKVFFSSNAVLHQKNNKERQALQPERG